jgi:hypothetical protein
MANHKVLAKRGPQVTVKLRSESHVRFLELTEHRFTMNLNSNKGDIMSQALDELYEKEIGQWKPKEKNGK